MLHGEFPFNMLEFHQAKIEKIKKKEYFVAMNINLSEQMKLMIETMLSYEEKERKKWISLFKRYYQDKKDDLMFN